MTEEVLEQAKVLLTQYGKEKARLDKVQEALELQTKKVAGIIKELHDACGKGPYDLGDGHAEGSTIRAKGETFYFVKERAAGGKKGGSKSEVQEGDPEG